MFAEYVLFFYAAAEIDDLGLSGTNYALNEPLDMFATPGKGLYLSTRGELMLLFM